MADRITWAVAQDDLAPLTPLEPDPPPRKWRMQCICGRFVKMSTYRDYGMDINGARSWGWTCSRCGDMRDGT